jgi:hypothetical protein
VWLGNKHALKLSGEYLTGQKKSCHLEKCVKQTCGQKHGQGKYSVPANLSDCFLALANIIQ